MSENLEYQDPRHGGYDISAQDGPGLRQRARRHGKEQDGRGAHRCDQDRQVRSNERHFGAEERRRQETDKGSDRSNDPVSKRSAGETGTKQLKGPVALFSLEQHIVSISGMSFSWKLRQPISI